jgi:hypothetical protein
MKLKKISLLAFTSYIVFCCSCAKNNKEDLIGNASCDTASVSYTQDIKPILAASCNANGCHNASSAASGYNLEDFSSLQPVALGSRFIGTIRHESGFSAMPKQADKLDDCKIKKIEIWIAEGAPNN